MIHWTEDAAEAQVWRELPPFLHNALVRDDFSTALSVRRDLYLREVEAAFHHSGIKGEYAIRESGDWHDGKCVLVAQCSDDTRVVVKPKPNDVGVLIGNICRESGVTANFSTGVPVFNKIGSFWLQDYVQPGAEALLTAEAFGGLISVALWFGLIDLHEENIIFANASVALIDVECAFYAADDLAVSQQLQISGLISRKRPGLSTAVLVCDEQSAKRSFWSALSHLLRGPFFYVYDLMDSLVLRRVLISTSFYMTFLRQRFTFGWTDNEVRTRWLFLRTANPASAAVVDYEMTSLLSWSVPYFYQVGQDLFSGTGDKVDSCVPASVGMREIHSLLSDTRQSEAALEEVLAFLRGRSAIAEETR